MRVSQIKYFKPGAVDGGRRKLQSAENPGDYVADVSVVAASRAIAIHGYRFAGFDQRREFMDREVRTLARAVHGEQAQANRRDRIEMPVGAAMHFAGNFG